MNKKVLVVVAHADDEVLGVGGTIARHVMEEDDVRVVFTADCRTARDQSLEPELSEEAQNSLRELGALRHVQFLGWNGMSLADGPELELNKEIGAIVTLFDPDIVYTHCLTDINSDHRAVANAVMVACRPIGPKPVKRLLHFETPSSSEWGAAPFVPNVFIDITGTIDKKLNAIRCYKSELREAPHPRNPVSLKYRAAYWGQIVGVQYAEPFILHREIL